jgi:membrane protease YdiL (CAAX protease family)
MSAPGDGVLQTRARRVAAAKAVAGMGVLAFWAVLLALATVAEVALLDAILLSILLVAVPTMALAQAPLVAGATIERMPAYWSSIATLWLIGSACWFVGTRTQGPSALGLVALPPGALAAWTAALTAAALAVIGGFRWLADHTGGVDSDLLRQLLPRTRDEKIVFGILSVAAGTGEELAYRGYVIPVLAPVLGVIGAAVVSTAVFAVMHVYQGTMGILRTGVMGAFLAGGFLASGSLWPPILAHTLIDVLAGIVLGERLLTEPTEPVE